MQYPRGNQGNQVPTDGPHNRHCLEISMTSRGVAERKVGGKRHAADRVSADLRHDRC